MITWRFRLMRQQTTVICFQWVSCGLMFTCIVLWSVNGVFFTNLMLMTESRDDVSVFVYVGCLQCCLWWFLWLICIFLPFRHWGDRKRVSTTSGSLFWVNLNFSIVWYLFFYDSHCALMVVQHLTTLIWMVFSGLHLNTSHSVKHICLPNISISGWFPKYFQSSR